MDFIRIALLSAMAFMLSTIATSLEIPILQRKRAGQNIREEGPESHQKKAGTPSMGGISIILATVVTCIAARQFSPETALIGISFIAFGLIGFADDYIKIIRRNNLGLRAWQKLALQLGIAVVLSLFIAGSPTLGTDVRVPFTGQYLDLGSLYIPFSVFVIVAVVNSVNLTDGLDGLAAGVTAAAGVFFAVVGVILGLLTEASFAACMAGACLGFLVFNRHPAKVFMGDTGSLALGGGLAAIAAAMDMELFLPIAGFVYVAEALSVLIQVAGFKLTGKRVFKMAPLHHHFELIGLKETKVVAIFWIAAIAFCTLGIGAL